MYSKNESMLFILSHTQTRTKQAHQLIKHMNEEIKEKTQQMYQFNQ